MADIPQRETVKWRGVIETVIAAGIVAITTIAFASYIELKELRWVMSSFSDSVSAKLDDHENRLRILEKDLK